jgi:hypothetical protein
LAVWGGVEAAALSPSDQQSVPSKRCQMKYL